MAICNDMAVKKIITLESQMSLDSKLLCKSGFVLFLCSLAAACVTETVESPSMRFSEAAVISVQDPNVFITRGSTFAWMPEAVRFYKDERLQNSSIKSFLEKEIIKNLLAKEMIMLESVSGSKYSIAYTAALESSLDDSAIINRFGLLPGNAQVPTNDSSVEKGSLIVYVFENKTADIVWRSAAQVGVKFDTPEAVRKQRIERVIAEMFQTLKVEK